MVLDHAMKLLALTCAAALICTTAWPAQKTRSWQTGTWQEIKVVRPKIVLGLSNRPVDGRRSSPFPPAMTEVRTYVIETETLRLELRETTRADVPRIDAAVGEPVTFALEKNRAYVKLGDHGEHQLRLVKRVRKTPE